MIQEGCLLRSCAKCGKEFESTTPIVGYICLACKRATQDNKPVSRMDLTPREKQLIGKILEAKSNKEIAYGLHLAEGTVKEYLSVIFKKLSVRNRTDLALHALKLKEENKL